MEVRPLRVGLCFEAGRGVAYVVRRKVGSQHCSEALRLSYNRLHSRSGLTMMPSSSLEPPSSQEDYMRLALSLAQKSPCLPTNYRVGAILVHAPTDTILSTGYTLELPGNTHAEQCCLLKLAAQHNVPPERVGEVLPEGTVLFTTMEPCVKRNSGQVACVERILALQGDSDGDHGGRRKTRLEKVYVGVGEPETFVTGNDAVRRLRESGVEYVLVEGLEEEILKVATAGHSTSTQLAQ